MQLTAQIYAYLTSFQIFLVFLPSIAEARNAFLNLLNSSNIDQLCLQEVQNLLYERVLLFLIVLY